MEEDGVGVIDVLRNDTGDLSPSTLQITTSPVHGAAVLVDGKVQYTPDPDFNGTDDFDYRICGSGGCDTAKVNISVIPVNDAPVAVDDVVFTPSLTGELKIAVLADNGNGPDFDVDGDVLTIIPFEGKSELGGSVKCDTVICVWTPAPEWDGSTDHFFYKVTDGLIKEPPSAKVTITGENAPKIDEVVVSPPEVCPPDEICQIWETLRNGAECPKGPSTLVVTAKVTDEDLEKVSLVYRLGGDDPKTQPMELDEKTGLWTGTISFPHDTLELKETATLVAWVEAIDGKGATVTTADNPLDLLLSDCPANSAEESISILGAP